MNGPDLGRFNTTHTIKHSPRAVDHFWFAIAGRFEYPGFRRRDAVYLRCHSQPTSGISTAAFYRGLYGRVFVGPNLLFPGQDIRTQIIRDQIFRQYGSARTHRKNSCVLRKIRHCYADSGTIYPIRGTQRAFSDRGFGPNELFEIFAFGLACLHHINLVLFYALFPLRECGYRIRKRRQSDHLYHRIDRRRYLLV